jgi:hypothetical protein
MKTNDQNDNKISRREFLKRGILGTLSLMGIALLGNTFFSSCEKDDDENDLAEAEAEAERKKKEEEQKKGQLF